MSVFSLDIPDNIVSGISAARAAFNASLAQVKDADGNLTDDPASFATDDDYFAARAISMVRSWADHAASSQTADAKVEVFPAAPVIR